MANLSRDQIAELARTGGFSGSDVDIAVAIAFAESGGNPNSHNTTPPDDSYGLWQINMYKDLGPSRRKWFGIKNDNALFDPGLNAEAAYKIYRASGWKAWTTYTSGKYKQFMNGGSETVTSPSSDTSSPSSDTSSPSSDTSSPSSDTSSPSSDTSSSDSNSDSGFLGIPGAINAVGSTIFKGLTNAVWLIVAIAIVITGLVILFREPIGKAAQLAGKIK